jgi:hypothetical protein
MPFELIYEAWHEWFYERWKRGEGSWCGGAAIYSVVVYEDYDGFGGDW